MNQSELHSPWFKLVNRCIVLVALGLILFFQASKPDETEFRVWIGMLITYLVTDGTSAIIRRIMGKGE